MRAELLPLLERRFNPAIVDVLADEAELAREEWQWMEAAAREAAAASRVQAGAGRAGSSTSRRVAQPAAGAARGVVVREALDQAVGAAGRFRFGTSKRRSASRTVAARATA